MPVKLDHSCHIVRPLRSKHCRVSRQCVVGFDHYCPYVGTTVGLQNYRWFYLYCVSFTLAALQWECLAISYVKTYQVSWLFYGAMAWFVCLFYLALHDRDHTQLVLSNLGRASLRTWAATSILGMPVTVAEPLDLRCSRVHKTVSASRGRLRWRHNRKRGVKAALAKARLIFLMRSSGSQRRWRRPAVLRLPEAQAH